MKRKLFCEISPTTYKISVFKCKTVRHLSNLLTRYNFAKTKQDTLLPYCIYSHNSLIRRKLGNVDLQLQENKAVNLSIAAPKICNILIKPNEAFSFWETVGKCDEKSGYKYGLTISNGKTTQDIGGGMCQFTNLLHWMIIHSELEITEYHHHDGYDLFPDFKRVVPFGIGTSIMYNYLDYRFKNNTDITYQIIVYTNETHLCGKLLADNPQEFTYHIKTENEFFSKENDTVYRNNEIYRNKLDTFSGNIIEKKLIKKNHAKVLYDTADLAIINKDSLSD